MRHDLLGAVIGKRQKRAAVVHDLFGAGGNGGERVDGNVHRPGEVVTARLDIATGQLVLVGKRDRMHDEVDLAPMCLDIGEDGVDAFEIGHVAIAGEEGVQFLGERLDTLLQRIALPGQRDLGALVATGLCDPPGDGAIVGDTHDDAALACHEAGTLNHIGTL